MAKWQASYRANNKMPDERVAQIQADVEKYGSFSNLFDAVYESWHNGETSDSAGTASSSGVTASDDNTEVLEAIENAKQAIIFAIEEHHPQTVEADISSASTPAPAQPAIVQPVAPSTIDMSPLVTSEAMGVHKADILRQIMETHQTEIAHLNKILSAVENIMEKIQSAPGSNIAPVAPVAEEIDNTEEPAYVAEPIVIDSVSTSPAATVDADTDNDESVEDIQEMLDTSAADKYFISAMAELVFDDDNENEDVVDEPDTPVEDDIEPFELDGTDFDFNDDDDSEDADDTMPGVTGNMEDNDADAIDSAFDDTSDDEPESVSTDNAPVEDDAFDMLDDLALLGLSDIFDDEDEDGDTE